MDNFDLLILGAGPAGLSAAIYALRYNLQVGIIGGIPGGLMMESHKICNWPGDLGIAGYELAGKMHKHAKELGAKFVSGLAESIEKQDDGFVVKTSKKEIRAKCVIYALGTEHRHLGLAAEDRLKGNGVAYCATCDAMFYKDKVTAVVGGGNSAMTAALYLADICPKVYMINNEAKLNGETAWMSEIEKRDNIDVINGNTVIDMLGDEFLEKIVLEKEYNDAKEIAVGGVFIEIGLIPKTKLFVDLGGEVDRGGYIKVESSMATNIAGMYAAGDVTTGSNGFRQVLTAAAEGAIAANSAFEFLQRNEK